MKRTSVVAVLLVALAFIGLAAPLAYGQAPAPKVTINGLIDQVMTFSKNNVNFVNSSNTAATAAPGLMNRPDDMWYARTRGRFDVTGEIGKAKAVLGIEIDAAYGQTGTADNSISTSGAQQCFGCSGGWDINTDVRTIVEIKWLYTEFQMPLIPVPMTVRLGAQPFGAAANYKIIYATGDFAGVNVVTQVSPNVKLINTYVQVEENLTGFANSFNTGSGQNNRGDDHAFILSAEITPFKGLDLKPMFSSFQAQSTTSGAARQGRGGISTSTPYINPSGNTGGTSQGNMQESRYTVGLDSRFRMGPLSIDPTFMYQFGTRAIVPVQVSGTPTCVSGYEIQCQFSKNINNRRFLSDISAFFFDLRAGYQLGPLLLQGLGVYTTGNSARNNTLDKVRYFQPLTTDTGYLADWGTQLTSLGLDYFSAFNEAGGRIAYPGVSIGWDKYGRAQLGFKATYAITPTLSVMAGVNGHWTAQAMDRNGLAVSGAGLNPLYATQPQSGRRDNTQYVGTEFMALLSWTMLPGLTWDNSFGYMTMGSALDGVTDNPSVQGGGSSYLAHPGRNTNDPYILTSRIRFTF
jgi:hypothetical protein